MIMLASSLRKNIKSPLAGVALVALGKFMGLVGKGTWSIDDIEGKAFHP
jgi:hypothetical protein